MTLGFAGEVPYRSVQELELRSGRAYGNPFADVVVNATFCGPSGAEFTIPGFYDGEGTWRVRFSPGETGRWTFRASSLPTDGDLEVEGAFTVTEAEGRGFLKAVPGRAWGFEYESGEPAFLLGDTVYNLFGLAHCGVDVEPFLRRRAAQGFNLIRARLPVSPFHPPEGHGEWHTRSTWPWGGSERWPLFDRFNLEYFRSVDRVVRQVEDLGDLGLELIMEQDGSEWPFNSRGIFVPEWEELWMRYLIARYDAFSCVLFWTPMNEYEFYPNGDWHHKPVADRWAIRIARWIKVTAQHGHIVSIHNGPIEPPFAERFAADLQAVDAVMFQEWGTRGEHDGWLAAGIEDKIEESLAGWPGSAVLAEYGYERNPDLPLLVPSHRYCDPEHTRRGAWRGAFCGLGIIHGFDNTWWPFRALLDHDQRGVEYLLHLRHFFTELVPFARMRPAPEIAAVDERPHGHRPLVLATPEREVVAVYLPTEGEVRLELANDRDHSARWFDPRTGALLPASPASRDTLSCFVASESGDQRSDWVLTLSARDLASTDGQPPNGPRPGRPRDRS